MERVIRASQRGATLIFTLVILMVVTLMGVSAIQDTTLEEKMAGNLRSRNLAFQGAESALAAGELYLTGKAVLPTFTAAGTSTGLYLPTTSSPSRWNAVDWSDASKVVMVSVTDPGSGDAIALSGLSGSPAYIIEELDASTFGSSLEAGKPVDTAKFYRITARAVAADGVTEVMLQSYYRR